MSSAVIIISHGHTDLLVEYWVSAFREMPKMFYVMDNLGERRLKNFCEKYGVRYFQNTTPAGFGANNNRVARTLFHEGFRGDIVFCNPDVLISGPNILSFFECFKKSECGWGTVEMKNGEDSSNLRNFPTVFGQISRFFGFKSSQTAEKISGPFWISGSFFAVNISLFQKVGGFDNRYFMYFEDVDLSRRLALEHGDPFVGNQHANHLSARKNRDIFSKHFFMFLSSMFKYYGKWGFR